MEISCSEKGQKSLFLFAAPPEKILLVSLPCVPDKVRQAQVYVILFSTYMLSNAKSFLRCFLKNCICRQ